jgi:hypothetical protein|tara:strand:+ start:987 stop:1238 length:252 start_codon:yes stop_codon:yes gene_type:complete
MGSSRGKPYHGRLSFGPGSVRSEYRVAGYDATINRLDAAAQPNNKGKYTAVPSEPKNWDTTKNITRGKIFDPDRTHAKNWGKV